MAHLPNELWLQIASCCDPLDLWLSFRRVNSQLSRCAEQHFKEAFLRDAVLTLPIAIPSYDMRNPRRGNITFKFNEKVSGLSHVLDPSRMTVILTETDPVYHRIHFISRWKSMQGSKGGQLNERMQWELGLCGRSSIVHLKDPVAEILDDGADGEARLSFEWRSTVTSFLRDHADLVRSVGL